MGRCEYREIGYGMDEEQAREDAINKAEKNSGHQDGYSGTILSSTHENDKSKCLKKPVISKTCNVNKFTHTGARQWKTIYKIECDHNLSAYNVVDTNQSDAINKAKELSLKYGETFTIRIGKKLVDKDPKIAEVSPKKWEPGKWEFTGTARE